MKREIKFRTWDGEAFDWWDLCEIANRYFQFDCSAEVMQYTGLKDKNGKEIYEGDIVTMVNSDHYMKGLLFKVHWLSNSFWMSDINGESETWSPSFFEWKVIGNIYENPELLNQ